MLAEARELRTRRDALLGSAGVETLEALEERVAVDQRTAQGRENMLLSARKTLEKQRIFRPRPGCGRSSLRAWSS